MSTACVPVLPMRFESFVNFVILYPPNQLASDTPVIGDGARIQGLPSAGLTQMIANINNMLQDLEGRAGGLFSQLEKVLLEMEGALVNANTQVSGAGELLPKIDRTLDRFAALAGTLDQEVKGLSGKVSDSMDTLVPSAEDTLRTVQDLTRQLQGDLTHIKTSLAGVMADTERLLTNTDNLILDNRRELEMTLITLRATLANLEVFTQRIAEKPSSLIMSRKKPLPEPLSEQERRSRELRESGLIDRKGDDGEGDQ